MSYALSITIWSIVFAACGYILGRTDRRKPGPTQRQRTEAASKALDMRLRAMNEAHHNKSVSWRN